jgi:hypothetical protein
MKKKPPTFQKIDANPDPKISKEELSDSGLNKATGGADIQDFHITKKIDKPSP